MTTKEKLGLAVIGCLFGVLAVLLWLTFAPVGGGSASFDDNAIVKQRVVNQQKSN